MHLRALSALAVMKFNYIHTALVATVALCLFGCKNREADAPPAAAARGEELFQEGRGLRLPDEMQRSLDVETIEVSERAMAQELKRAAHVFRAAADSQPGAALVWLNDSDATKTALGQNVSLRVRDELTVPGRLVRLEQGLTNLRGQSEAVVEFSAPGQPIPVGSLLTAVFSSASTNAVTAVPVAAVVRGVEGAFVYTANGAHYLRTPVRLGAESDGWVEVTDGLYAGDVVVARGVSALWNIELCALKGGTPCCPVPKKSERGDG